MTGGLDLSDPRFRADPYSHYRLLRENDPVHWSDPAGAWVLTRYDDVRATLVDARFAHWTEALETAPSPFLRSLAKWLWLLQPRSNSRLRELIQPLFTTAAAEAMRPQIAARARSLTASDPSDLIDQLAEPLTMFAAALLLGVPDDDAFYARARDLMNDFETLWIAQIQQQSLPASAARFAEYVSWNTGFSRSGVPAEAGAPPNGNFIGALDRARREGDPITSDDVFTFLVLFLFAAQENIKSFIGNAVLALAQDDDAWRALRDAPALIPAAVEELLRFDSPVQFVALRARENVALRDRVIRAGDAVFAGIAAANRDPEEFAHPEKLDFQRKSAQNLSFGWDPLESTCRHASLSIL